MTVGLTHILLDVQQYQEQETPSLALEVPILDDRPPQGDLPAVGDRLPPAAERKPVPALTAADTTPRIGLPNWAGLARRLRTFAAEIRHLKTEKCGPAAK
jgi:hypothetical protein